MTPLLPESCSHAFKEWAVICQALATGKQTIIVRKGGIHEGQPGFRVQHRDFWLYPTHFHTDEINPQAKLAPESWPVLQQQQAFPPPEGFIWLQELIHVEEVHELTEEAQLAKLAGWHWWSPQTIHDRFHYRQPGLYVLLVRAFTRSSPHIIPVMEQYAGCKSWVVFPYEIPTAGLIPAINDGEFAHQRERFWSLFGPRG